MSMHFSRKRYRPLDSAEERMVHVNQRVQLLPLEDEQSYCFSWPDAPLTHWLQENAAYANLYQLIAGNSALSSSNSTSGTSNALNATGFTDAFTSGTAGELGGRRDALRNESASLSSSSSAAFAAAAASLSTRHVDLPPVFTLSDHTVAPLCFTPPLPDAPPSSQGEDLSRSRYERDIYDFLRRLHRNIDAVNKETSSLSETSSVELTTTANLGNTTGREPKLKGMSSWNVAKPRAPGALSTSITIPADAPRAMPHPLAPPRPQSITEDSIFTLSASQLTDLVNAGVPALCAAEEVFHAEQQQQQRKGVGENSREYALENVKEDVERETGEGGELPTLTSTRARIVVIEENDDDDDTEEKRTHESIVVINNQSNISPPTFSLRSKVSNLHTYTKQKQQTVCLSEPQRRVVEAEVVALEWRTWAQSQRTAAALQRLLSLEAAVPFEPCGDAHRDAWRVVVYRLWLRWRQQFSPEMNRAAVISANAPVGCHAVRVSSLTRAPFVFASAPAFAPSSSDPLPERLYAQPHRLPWGVPLLAGAYLCGTSNDYFVSLPPAIGSAGATAGTGTTATGAGGSGGSISLIKGDNGFDAPMWSGVSRRRGIYKFLRWRVELYTAQLPQPEDGPDHTEGAENNNDINDNDGSGADKVVDVGVMDEGGSEDVVDGAPCLKVSRYSKGPLGQAGTFSSGRPRRRLVADKAGVVPLTTSSASFQPTAGASRRAPSTRVATQVTATRPVQHHSLNAVMSAAQIKALIQTTVLKQPLTELQLDDEPSVVMERLACQDLKHETDAWRVWLSKV